MTHDYTTSKRLISAVDAHKKSGTSTFSLPTLLPQVDRNYCAVAQRCRAAFRDASSSFLRTCYVIVCLAYRLAERLRDDDGLWEKFQNDSFFDGHSRLNRDYCLRYALMYMYSSHHGRHAERARDHARAVQWLWEKEASAREVFSEFSEGGFRRQKTAKQKRTNDKGGGSGVLRQTFEVADEGISKKLKRFKDGDDVVAQLRVRKNARGQTVIVVRKVALKDRHASNPTASKSRQRERRSARHAVPDTRGRTRAARRV